MDLLIIIIAFLEQTPHDRVCYHLNIHLGSFWLDDNTDFCFALRKWGWSTVSFLSFNIFQGLV